MTLSTRLDLKERTYTGIELRPHFLLTEMGIRGSGIGAFIGPCLVKTEHLVDWEDRLANDFIRAKKMVHFIGEFFGIGLREGVFIQRLWMSVLAQQLGSDGVQRSGDDLFVGDRKLSVSIVTASPVSLLLHTGINIDPDGAPVSAIGLTEMGVDPEHFTHQVLKSFGQEWQDIEWACAKVRPVI